jgi:hypothetical protein
MDKLFELLGLGKPFVYAAGTFAFFYWLDSNASDEAKKELARLVSVKDLQPKAVSVGITDDVRALVDFSERQTLVPPQCPIRCNGCAQPFSNDPIGEAIGKRCATLLPW